MTEPEGRWLTALVRRGREDPIRVCRATIILASSSGTPVAAIARLVAADEQAVRHVIHAFSERGLATLDPQGAGGRLRPISDDDNRHVDRSAGRSRLTTRANESPAASRTHPVGGIRAAAALGSAHDHPHSIKLGCEDRRSVMYFLVRRWGSPSTAYPG